MPMPPLQTSLFPVFRGIVEIRSQGDIFAPTEDEIEVPCLVSARILLSCKSPRVDYCVDGLPFS